MIQRPAPGAGRALRRDARLLRDWAPARGLTPLRLLDAAPGASRWLLGPDPVAGDPRRRDSAPPARSGVRELILVREPRRGPEAGWAALPPRERRARHSAALQLLAGLGTETEPESEPEPEPEPGPEPGGAVVEVDASRRALLLPPSRGASRRVPLLSRHRWRALSAGEAAGLLGAVGRLAAQARARALCLGEVRPEALLLGAGGLLLLRSVASAHPLRDAGCCGVPPAGSTARLLDLAPEASRARLRSAQEQSLAEAEREPAALSELLRYHLRGALTPVPVALPD